MTVPKIVQQRFEIFSQPCENLGPRARRKSVRMKISTVNNNTLICVAFGLKSSLLSTKIYQFLPYANLEKGTLTGN